MSQLYINHISILLQLNFYIKHVWCYVAGSPTGANMSIKSEEKEKEKKSLFI